MQFIIHMLLHFMVPAVVARIGWKRTGFKSYLIMMSTMLIDLDHLLASPILSVGRCSIGFHPLHDYFMLPIYLVLATLPQTRLLGLGLVIHMMLDSLDCLLM